MARAPPYGNGAFFRECWLVDSSEIKWKCLRIGDGQCGKVASSSIIFIPNPTYEVMLYCLPPCLCLPTLRVPASYRKVSLQIWPSYGICQSATVWFSYPLQLTILPVPCQWICEERGRSVLLAENLARPQTVAASRRNCLYGQVDIAFPPVERPLHEHLLRFHYHVFLKKTAHHPCSRRVCLSLY